MSNKDFPSHIKSRFKSTFYIILGVFMATWCMLHFMRVGVMPEGGEVGGMIVIGLFIGSVALATKTLLGRIRYKKSLRMD